MKERQILFNAEMVKAVLEGRKTQTRRIVKPQPKSYNDNFDLKIEDNIWTFIEKFPSPSDGPKYCNSIKCPYGKSGDRLWVREAFHLFGGEGTTEKEQVHYRATNQDPVCDKLRWNPSIHMPRWASRLTLEITDIRVERVQEIKWQDAKAEGYVGDMPMIDSAPWFSKLWNSINEKRGYSWESNPWVWVIEFKKIK